MIKQTVLFCVIVLSLLSCASVNAKQGSTFETIDGFTSTSAATSQLARQHQGTVLSLAAVPGTDSFFSAGKDGFLVYHSADGNDDEWQISDIPLKGLSVHPDGNLIAVYESDGFSIHRISVWDWANKKRLYAKRFRDSILSISWSARGTYLMVGNTSIEGITILEGSTGTPESFFNTPPGIVSLSLTGATETSMITYGPSGRILYTDLTTKKERASYAGQPDLTQPILLNNMVNFAPGFFS